MLGDNFRFLMSPFPIEEPLGYTNDGYPDWVLDLISVKKM